MGSVDSQSHTDAVVIHDDDGIVYVTDSFLSLFGLDSRESVVGTPVRDHVSPSDRDALTDQFDRIESGDASALGLTITVSDATGDSREVVTLSSPISWDGADRIRTLCIGLGSSLTASTLMTSAMDASPVGVSIADAQRDDCPLVYVNDEFVELTGYPREEVLGRNCRFLQGAKTRPEPVTKVRNAIDNGESATVELRNYHKDGTMFWNRLSVRPITDDEGTVTYYLGFQEDISAEKSHEHERVLFETQADAVGKSLFITDTEGVIQYVNPQFERTTGYTAEEAIGQTPRILNSGAHSSEFYGELWETITTGDVWEATITNERKSGERYTVEQKIVPIADEDGEITHFAAIEDDITDRQFTEEVLGVIGRVLRHNVRNSVTAIRGFAEMLEEDIENPEDRAALQAIRDHAASLEEMSNRSSEIRELFRRRREQPTLEVGAIGEFVERHRADHPAARIELSMDADPDRKIRNGSLLRIAIDEAIENAVVHNDREEPRVEVRVTDSPDAEVVRIDISDDGPGIPEDEWDVIFSGRETQLAHGSGIGLWMMYWTITALGGTIERSENDPRGSVISYEVPINEPKTDAEWDLSIPDGFDASGS